MSNTCPAATRMLPLLPVLLAVWGCGTTIRRETHTRTEGRETLRVEYVTPEEYSGSASSLRQSPGSSIGQDVADLLHSDTPSIMAAASEQLTGADSAPASGRPPAYEPSDLEDGNGLEARYSRSRIWTKLATSFRSASFTGLTWNSSPKTSGAGPEFACYFSRENVPIGFRLGAFNGESASNFHREGAFYVRETTRTKAYWLDAEARHSFNRWFFMTVGLGGFLYHLETEIDTNVPSYVYETADVTGVFGALGLGAGIETPWDFPLRLFAATSFWLPCTREDVSFEWGIGQISAGAAYRF